MGFLRLVFVALLVALGSSLDSSVPIYIIFAPLGFYSLFYIFFHRFKMPIFGRIRFVLGEMVLYVIFSLMVFGPQHIKERDLDFFLITVVLGLDIVYYITRTTIAGIKLLKKPD